MRLRYPILVVLMFVVIVGVLAVVGQMPSAVTTGELTTPDDEIAYVNSASHAQVVDPYTAPGNQPFQWTSSTAGWTDIAPLDANGDGVDELVAIGGNRVEILTPYTPSGSVPPQFSQTIGSGFFYNWVIAGDIIPGDNHLPEILVQRTDNRNNSSYSIQIYDSNAAGTVWTQVFDRTYGSTWLNIQLGDVDGLEGDEVVMVRNVDKRLLIFKYASSSNWPTIFERTYGYSWITMNVGNSHVNNGAIDDIHLTRSGVLDALNSFLTFQYFNNNVSDAPNGSGIYFPAWKHVASGDVNLSGDEEVFMVRDPQQDNGVSLLGLNWGSDTMPSAWTEGLAVGGRNLQRVVMGDTDGDKKDEVVIATTSDYRIYTEPGSNLNNNGINPASFRLPVSITLGNFDGSGVSSEPAEMLVSPTSLYFEMTRNEANPSSQTIDVTNIGGSGNFAYDVTLEKNSSWLSVSPFDSVTPGQHTVSINGSGLGAGLYEDTIIITAVSSEVLESPQSIPVTLTVKATGPILQVEPASLSYEMNFGGVPPLPVGISVKNVGDGGSGFFEIEITTDDGANWIKSDSTSGWTDDEVTITIDPSALSSGQYSGNIRFDAGVAEGSPADVPVSLKIDPTGMEVTPTNIFMQAFVDQPSPMAGVQIDQAAPGSGAIKWYAYVVPSGDWWGIQDAYRSGKLTVARSDKGYVFTSPKGKQSILQYVPWVVLTPNNGITPRTIQVSLDMAEAPVGESRVTILIDGGPDTPNRFQGVDLRILVSDGGVWLPSIVQE